MKFSRSKKKCKFALLPEIHYLESQIKNITEKNYKKLSVQLSLHGLSFCSKDILSGNIIQFGHVDFESYPKNFTVENCIWKSFLVHDELTKSYDEIVVLHENNLSAFVPKAFFDEDYKGSYLQYNTKVFETDFFTYDSLDNYEMVNVYVPYVNINNYLIDQFGTFEYKHFSSVLVSKLLNLSKNDESKTMYVHVSKYHFEIVVIQNQKLLLYNSFEYKTPQDFIYYILFTAEQLYMNPENFKLKLSGEIAEHNPLYVSAYQYIRNIELLNFEYSELKAVSAEDYRKNLVIFNV